MSELNWKLSGKQLENLAKCTDFEEVTLNPTFEPPKLSPAQKAFFLGSQYGMKQEQLYKLIQEMSVDWPPEVMGVPMNTPVSSQELGTSDYQWVMRTGRWSKTAEKSIPYPGLTDVRRIVLDLSFNGYRMSGEVVDKDGDLLGIAPPGAKFDPVPGSIYATLPLGEALKKLEAAGAEFDLIVCELPSNTTTPRVGAFAPPPEPLARSGRRLILPGRTTPKLVAPEMPMTLAVWRATQKLLSKRGEALIGMDVIAFNDLVRMKEPGVERIWWAHLKHDTYVHVYVAVGYTNGCRVPGRVAPTRDSRSGRLRASGLAPVKGQRNAFMKALGIPPKASSSVLNITAT